MNYLTVQDLNAIDALRTALAAIWTELAKDSPSEQDCMDIADMALDMTKQYAPKVKGLSNSTGMESWLEHYPAGLKAKQP